MNRYAAPPHSYPSAAAPPPFYDPPVAPPGAAAAAPPPLMAIPNYPSVAPPGAAAATAAAPPPNSPVYPSASAPGSGFGSGSGSTEGPRFSIGPRPGPSPPLDIVSFDQLEVGKAYTFFTDRSLAITETNMDGEKRSSYGGKGVLQKKQYARSGGLATFIDKESSTGSTFNIVLKYPEGQEETTDITTVKLFICRGWKPASGGRRSNRKSRRNSRKSRKNSRNNRR